MTVLRSAGAAALMIAFFAASGTAQHAEDDHDFNLQIDAISELALGGEAQDLRIEAPVAGSGLEAVSGSGGTYSYTNNRADVAIFAQADFATAPPAGLVLKLSMSPTSGTGTGGDVFLEDGASHKVTAIGQETGGATLQYELSAALTDGAYDSDVTVTFTIADDV